MADITRTHCMKTLVPQTDQLVITCGDEELIIRICAVREGRVQLHIAGPRSMQYATAPRDAPGACTVPII